MQDLLTEAKGSTQLLSELRERAKSSLYFLTKAILGFDALTPSFHQEIAHIVQDIQTYPFLLVILPRKHFKSTIGTIGFPIWLQIQDHIPIVGLKGADVRTLIANESSTNAEHFLSIIEKIWESNELLNLLFPHLSPLPSSRKRWNAQEMLLNREAAWPEASIETIGVGGAAQSRHYDVRILDDLIGKEAMDSQTVMDKTIQWYDYSESLSVSPLRSICRVYGTRWTKRDLYQHIIDNDTKFHVYSRECIENGVPIFPEWYTVEYYDDLRRKNPAHYFSQYCNNPSDPSKCDFKIEWLKYYTFEYKDEKTYIKYSDDDKLIPFSELDIIAAFDPSIDEKQTSCKRAIVFGFSDHKGRVGILDYHTSRNTIDLILDKIYEMYARWRPRTLLIESVALQRLFIPLIERENRLRNKWIHAEPLKVSTQRSKMSRIRDNIQEVAAQGRFYIQDTMREFEQEWIDFPNGVTNDLLDATAMVTSSLRVPEAQEEMDQWNEYEDMIIRDRSMVTGY